MIGLLRDHLAVDPNAPLLVDAHAEHPLVVTRAAFWRRVEALHAELSARGVGDGGCVAVWLPNWSDALVWQFAAVSLGAHVIGINTRYNVEEATHVLALARPAVVAVAHGFAKLDLNRRLAAAAAASSVPRPLVAVVPGPHDPPATPDEASAYDLGAGAWVPGRSQHQGTFQAELRDRPDRLASAFATSGSTGRPKLAAHRVSAVAGHARACAAMGSWDRDSVTLCCLPLTGVFAFVPAMATIAAGGTCLLEPVFDADAAVRDMERHGVTHVVAADDVVGRLADAVRDRERRGEPPDLSRWKHLLLADFNGRAEELARWAEDRLGQPVRGIYGSSELFALTGAWPPGEPLPRRWRGGGRPVSPAIQVRAGHPDGGEALAPGEPGELQFRGPNVVDAYLGDPDRRAAVHTPDGWFRSGDLGTVHADGSFEYLCRIGDALRLKGFLVEPAEIENRLAAHEAVAAAKVVGLRGPDGETEAVAFAVLRDGCRAGPEELVAWCAQALARHKVPRAVHLIPGMPVTVGVNGTKIRAATLREWAVALDREPNFVPPTNGTAGA